MIFPRRTLAISLVIILVSLLGLFLFFKKKTAVFLDDSPQDSSPLSQKIEEIPIPVKVTPVQRGELIIKLRSLGEAVTDKKITMKAEVSGIIKNLNVEEGKHVKKGDLLVELNDLKYRLELEKREILRLEYLSKLILEQKFTEPKRELRDSDKEKIYQAKKEYEKANNAYNKGLISKKEYERAKGNYEFILIESGGKRDEIRASSLTQAEIGLKQAQIELERTRIRAPFAGIITDIRVSPHEQVEIGRELFILVNISRIKVEAKVLESEVGKLKVNREAELRFSAYPGRTFKGRVKAISPLVNPEDKTCKVFIDVVNPKEAIKPGMHAEVEIVTETYKDRLIIPQEAILVRRGRKLAFVVEDGLAKWRYIEIGLENEDYAEILDGVKENELVIIEGHFTLAHDAHVTVAK